MELKEQPLIFSNLLKLESSSELKRVVSHPRVHFFSFLKSTKLKAGELCRKDAVSWLLEVLGRMLFVSSHSIR